MPISILDLVVIGVVLISALLAAVRGFTREVLAIFAWASAAAAAWFLHPLVLPTVKQYIQKDTIALVAAIGGIFILTLIVVSIITVKISDLILDSRIGALDRTLGFVFGAGRGLLLCVIGWVFFAWLAQGKMPDWANTARTRPLLENSGNSLMAMLPDNPEGLLKQLRNKPKGDEPSEPPAEPDPSRVTPPPAPQRRS
ncbi:MAG TPA: CvpA family protein [Beijerinckiaceae bacterium]|jgi:membrane protein required for colicin V production